MKHRHLLFPALALLASPAHATGSSFVNWETPHVHPLEKLGSKLLAVNTADNRLLIFDLSGGTPSLQASIPVGLDPVSVRAHGSDEAWVVNHISDTVSVVKIDLVTPAASRVIATLATRDEPADVVFAGNPERAFVSCAQARVIQVYDPIALGAPLAEVPIDAEQPRAMAVSPVDGKVYIAVFESGNGTTVLAGGANLPPAQPPDLVGVDGPYTNPPYNPPDPNPPPNCGTLFDPPRNLLEAPVSIPVGLIVKRYYDAGVISWKDDNGEDWTEWVRGSSAPSFGRPLGWDLPDRDVAILNPQAPYSVSYAFRLMNINMAIAVNPSTGRVVTVGTDAINQKRFEPNVRAIFGSVNSASFAPAAPDDPTPLDLNTHITYNADGPFLSASARLQSVGDPRGIVFRSNGTQGYVTGMGSNNVVTIDGAGGRSPAGAYASVGEGPTGLVLDESANRLYVLNRFSASITTLDASSTPPSPIATTPFFDPTPLRIKAGRKHFYATTLHSGYGQVACATCHVDGKMDRLGWDLGNPLGENKCVNDANANEDQNLGMGIPGLVPGAPGSNFSDFQNMKGVMTTQTLQDIIGREPLHWRGDRDGIEEFKPAFGGLQGADPGPTDAEIQDFEDFLSTIYFPPNPYRNFDNSLSTAVDLTGHFDSDGTPYTTGDAVAGLDLFRNTVVDQIPVSKRCITCHALPAGLGANHKWNGSSFDPIAPGLDGQSHHGLVAVDQTSNLSTKIPHLRNLYKKVGFELEQTLNRAGFGFMHDGAVDSISRFFSEPTFLASVMTHTNKANLIALMLSFAGSDFGSGPVDVDHPPDTGTQDTRASVGEQTTLPGGSSSLIAQMEAEAALARVGLVVKGRQSGIERGWMYDPASASYRSDRASEGLLSPAALQALATTGSELTWTVVPYGTQTRIGIDRDEDGFFDRTELDAGTDPANPNSNPCGGSIPAPPSTPSLVSATTSSITIAWSDPVGVKSMVEQARFGAQNFEVKARDILEPNSYTDSGLRCGTSYTYRVRTHNSCGQSAFSTNTFSTSICPVGTRSHVDKIEMAIDHGGCNGPKARGQAQIKVLDEHNNPRPNAVVHYTWSGSYSFNGTATTDNFGWTPFFYTPCIRLPRCWRLDVTDITPNEYDCSENVITRGQIGESCTTDPTVNCQ